VAAASKQHGDQQRSKLQTEAASSSMQLRQRAASAASGNTDSSEQR